jgi:hypothetical protein
MKVEMTEEMVRAIEAMVMVAQEPVPTELMAQLLEIPSATVETVCAELAVPVFAPTNHTACRVDPAGVIFTHFDAAQRRECRDFCGRGDNCPRYRRNPELAGVAPPTKEFSCTHFGTRRIIAHFDLCGRR